jgi:hypothetical protein
MEQPIAQPTHEAAPETKPWLFARGNRANPRGRARVKDLIAAETVRLMENFLIIHGRAPTAAEATRIHDAADSVVNSRRRLTDEARVKFANVADRRLRSLGLLDMPVPAPATRAMDERTVHVHVEEKLRPQHPLPPNGVSARDILKAHANE